ncbi:MAG: hypothetical protein HZA25_01685 [Candidatus Niyogibacteria bacterium]|nr:hypothetical protein [Candidatus Niyogibacteria bacterium]
MNISELTGELWARMLLVLKRISSGRVREIADIDPSKDSGGESPVFGSIRHKKSAVSESKAEEDTVAEYAVLNANKGKGIDKKV